MARLAILAGRGVLPHVIAEAHPNALFVHFEGVPVELPANEKLHASLERIGELFSGLRHGGVTELVFAGSLERPKLNPAGFDSRMRELFPRIFPAIRLGDDGLLRVIAGIFEDEAFEIRGAHELVTDLTAQPGLLAGSTPSSIDREDARHAYGIVSALSGLDVGQAAVVAEGQVLGIETVQGTDAMLHFVARATSGLAHRRNGVLVKAPKVAQDLRFDMPTIGPGTIDAAAKARLAGIFIEAGRVLVLERAETVRMAEENGLFLFAENPRCSHT